MPIANCFVTTGTPPGADELILKTFSSTTGIPETDITLNFIRSESQSGKRYACMLFLYLPSVWTAQDVRRIELVLFGTVRDVLNLKNEDIFLITTVVESGNVVSDGEVEEW